MADHIKTTRANEENSAENPAQRQSDAPSDASSERGESSEASDRAGGRGSDANGVPAFDESDGKQRRRRHEGGAGLVSRID